MWVDEREQTLLADHDVKVMHCPGSNLKLGSGIAPVAEMRRTRHHRVARRRRRRLQQPPRHVRGNAAGGGAPGDAAGAGRSARARGAVDGDARGRAHARARHEIGSVEAGKKADLILVSRDRPHLAPDPDPYSTLVYAARGSDVRTTIVDGELLVDEGELVRVSPMRRRGGSGQRARAEGSSRGARRCIMFLSSLFD